MKIKGIGKIFLICSIIVAMLVSFKNIFLTENNHLMDILSDLMQKTTDRPEKEPSLSQIESSIYNTLATMEVKKREIATHFYKNKNRKEIVVSIPKGRPHEWVIWKLTQCIKNTSYSIYDCYFEEKKKRYVLHYRSNNPNNEKIILYFSDAKHFYSESGKMAIVIEDFDFEANKTTMDFLSFPEPLTISLIPTHKKSGWTAQIADEYNKEVIIHLTFESNRTKGTPSSSIIKIHYPEESIRQIIHNAMKIIPNFSGFSNYNESIALGDSRIMNIVLNEVKKQQCYFINTYVNKHTVIPEISYRLQVPYCEITYKIMEESNISLIEQKIKQYAIIAQKMRTIIITAKARYSFIQGLKNVYPALKENGIQLVYVSDILKN